MSALAVTDAEVEAFIAAHVRRGEIDAADGVHDSFAQVRAGLEAAAELRKGEWMPIESAPRDSMPRLYLCRGRVVQGFVDVTGVLIVQHELGWRRMRRNPSHWQPLPPPPAPAGADEGEANG